MKEGSLACLLLFLLLGSGEASLMRSGEADLQEKLGKPLYTGWERGWERPWEKPPSKESRRPLAGLERKPELGNQEARTPTWGMPAHKLVRASHALKNTGSEAGRQAENIIGHGGTLPTAPGRSAPAATELG